MLPDSLFQVFGHADIESIKLFGMKCVNAKTHKKSRFSVAFESLSLLDLNHPDNYRG